MAECFKCGISDEKTRLFDAISERGVVKICDECSRIEDIPIVKRPTTLQLKQTERVQKGLPGKSVYDRVSRMSGFAPARQPLKGGIALEGQETSLRALVDRNLKKRDAGMLKPQLREDLVSNFHWIIMRARRMKKLTQEQLAREIGESESAIKMAEQGILPEDDYKLINKLESFFRVKLRKEKSPEPAGQYISFGQKGQTQQPQQQKTEAKKSEQSKLTFNSNTTKNLTISDLKEMREREKKAEMERQKEFEELYINLEDIDLDSESEIKRD